MINIDDQQETTGSEKHGDYGGFQCDHSFIHLFVKYLLNSVFQRVGI